MSENDKTNKELLQEVVHKVDQTIAITTDLKSSYEDLKKSHYEQREIVTEIDHTLRGTKIERETGKGGMAKQVQVNSQDINCIKKKQTRIFAWGTVILTFLNICFFAFIAFWKSKKGV